MLKVQRWPPRAGVSTVAENETLTAAERQRFLQALPWHLNNTLDAGEQAWMADALRRCPWATQALARERALLQSVAAPQPADADLGLQALLSRVRPAPPRAEAPRAAASWAQTVWAWLATPQLGAAMAAVVLAQALLIGWMVSAPPADTGMRSTPVTEVRTLRVVFVPEATEAQLRSALRSAGARVVGGPTAFGEYWLASDQLSLDEMKTLLLASGLTRSIDVDLAGPRGQ